MRRYDMETDDSIAVSPPMRAAAAVYLVAFSISAVLAIWLVLALIAHLIWPETRLPQFPASIFISSSMVWAVAKVAFWWLARAAVRRSGD